jgi:hypothetical protein
MYKHHIFLIHSSVVGHLDCFYSLNIVNNSAIKKVPLPPHPHVICVLDDSHSNRSEEKSSHGFDLHFFYGQECWAFLHLFSDHLDFFL